MISDTIRSHAASLNTRRSNTPQATSRKAALITSHQITFTRSPRRPRKTKRCPANGSCCSVASAWAASAAKPRRMSVTPAASQTLVVAGTGITRTGPGSTGPVPRDRSGH